ncbi:CRP-like cAMP-binding protein [Murinocardiopsis flavida]|uniref:CRP-like cAMP-binding protein n=1 Tax=Murinocardiopsis flavida TaxID=645275 RepID=A0A2P8DEV4_9ACTN|nr:Crp/Fnr family transcriptional regulator [Murinocardiopsis flavida]PSK95740.1 CRP-like cAMP-binding protein [Murinocardiopsis flavida]
MARQGFGSLLTDTQWQELASGGSPRSYRPDDLIMIQGDPGTTVHLIVHGIAKVLLIQPEGTEVPLAFRAAGELLGEPSIWSRQRRAATVVAASACTTRVFRSDRFRRRIQAAGLESAVWQTILRRQRESDELRAEWSVLSARRRLAAALLRLSDTLGEPIGAAVGSTPGAGEIGVLLRIALSQQELADYIGVSRTSVALEYARLKELGVIRTGRSFVAIHDRPTLAALARGERE